MGIYLTILTYMVGVGGTLMKMKTKFFAIALVIALTGAFLHSEAVADMTVSKVDPCSTTSGLAGSYDLKKVTATFIDNVDDAFDKIVVEVETCGEVDARVKYRVHFDHTAPFFYDADRNGDQVVDDLDVCYTTSDDGMMQKDGKATGPGAIDDSLTDKLVYEVLIDELNPDGDRVYIWVDAQYKGIKDRVPDTQELEPDDTCSKPENETEVLTLDLTPQKLVFVTSGKFNGDLVTAAATLTGSQPASGLAAGDAICQYYADQASLGGVYKAWLSDSTTSAKDRLIHFAGPYVRTDGVKVADDWTDLTTYTFGDPNPMLDAAINVDETGANQYDSYQPWAWTGTAVATVPGDGGFASGPFCSDWSSTSVDGKIGAYNLYQYGNWSNDSLKPCSSSNTIHLYCLEQ